MEPRTQPIAPYRAAVCMLNAPLVTIQPANGKIASDGRGILQDSIAIKKATPQGPKLVTTSSIQFIKGTKILSEKQEGEKIDIIGPLGYGTFNYENKENLAIIGGGIGVFPLYELAKCAKKENKKVNTYLGFRNQDFVVLEKEFEQVSDKLIITTDDGSYSQKGFAINYLEKDLEEGKIDSIYACGPLPMLKAVQKLAIKKQIPCQISLEEKMACGLGVCLGCAVKTAKSSKEAPEYWHVCKAGPVFNAKDVEIQIKRMEGIK